MELTKSQAEAMETMLSRVGQDSLISLTGPAGTGKTTMIDAMVERLEKMGLDVAVCTPTNKAAQVLRSKGILASTFYKLFYILEETIDGRPRFISCKRYLEEGRGSRSLPEGKTAYVDVLLLDEGSMVTSRSAMELQKMCGTLVLVGDHNQLPPVGDRDYPAGMFCSLSHTASLTEVLRQSEGSRVLDLANAIRANDNKVVNRVVNDFAPDVSFRELVLTGAQMIAYTNNERRRINMVCRRVLGFSKDTPLPGDKVIVTNNYSDSLINGTLVEVTDFDWNGMDPYGSIAVKDPYGNVFAVKMNMLTFINDQVLSAKNRLSEHFNPPKPSEEVAAVELTFGYCLTAHKSQGSEWDSVVVFDQRGLIKKVQQNDIQAGMSPDEYVRRWFYTAVTRARKHLFIVPTWFAQVSANSED